MTLMAEEAVLFRDKLIDCAGPDWLRHEIMQLIDVLIELLPVTPGVEGIVDALRRDPEVQRWLREIKDQE